MATFEGMEQVKSAISRYVDLTEAQWEQVLPLWKERSFDKKEVITASGDVERWFSIVKEGVQRIYFEFDGQEACIGFAYGGSWSGIFDSFVTQAPSRFVLQAVTPSVLLSIEHTDLQRLYGSVPQLERFGRLMLEEVFVGRAVREIEQLTMPAQERYDRLMDRSPHLLQLVPQKDIASYLGMSAETFSRLRAQK
ncbi:MAG: Crp/Fnr family transcriptional regulator [Flavobacteriales bacterium]|nr:Crp/Fnr family transcriptional regulator [Flavobacteriales bacterium]